MTRDTDTTLEAVATSPSTSYWLRDALRSALDRDPVDAAADAAYLALLLAERRDGILYST